MLFQFISNILNSPAISVILPFFNAEKTLDNAISSISRQTHPNFECLLIDNNSGDKSREIARRWTHYDPRFVLLTEARQGVVFASNTGWEQSRGHYVARMDADDLACSKRLQKQAKFLDNQKDYGAVAGMVKYVSHSADKKGFNKYVEWNNSVITYEDILKNRFIDAPVINPTAMWRREVAEKHGMYRSGEFPEDYEMWLRWLHQGVNIRKIPFYILEWHDYENRLTRNHTDYSDEAFYRIKTYYLVKWLERNNSFHPRVMVWGASRISRARAELLESYGIKITAFIDIKKTRQLNKDLIYYQDLPDSGHNFILVYVRQWYAKPKIKDFLCQRGYEEGKNFLFIS
ncbi:MAG: glycosyltransferase family 2 protein [Bacteroidales bacterium]